jgi:hypothetical protein
MGRTAVLNYCKTQTEAIAGIRRSEIGRLDVDPLPESDLPMAIHGAPQPRWQGTTFRAGGEGELEARYPVNILVFLGRKDMARADAEALQADFADRFRAMYANDPTLGGLVWDQELSDGIDNIDTFKEAGQHPQATYRLDIIERRKRNAAVS